MMSAFVLLIFLPGFRAEKVERVSLSGPVENISGDQKVLGLNGEKIALSADTLIVDEEGNRLGLHDIKPQAEIAIEALRHVSNKRVEVIKVIVKKPKRNMPPK